MKKFLLGLLMAVCFSVPAFSQMQYYRSTSFASKYVNTYGNWTAWSDWTSSNLTITIDLTNDIITIYSPERLKFRVISEGSSYTDASGGSNIKFNCMDMIDNIYCNVRLRMETNGNSQIYVEYSNLMLVYNVRRTQ